MTITIESYSEYSLVVRGDTKRYKKFLLDLEGKFNSNLKGGAGWIFSKKKSKEAIEKLQADISSGKIQPVDDDTPDTGSSVSGSSVSNEWVSIKSYLSLLSRVERLEQICSHSPFVGSTSSSTSSSSSTSTSSSSCNEIQFEDEDEERENDREVVGFLRKKGHKIVRK